MDGREYFVKKNQLSFLPFFQAEARALTEMHNTRTIRVPTVIAHGTTQTQAYLVLEYIEEGSAGSNGQATLGTLLAKMHRVVQPHFGWSMDNCIGATPNPTQDRKIGPPSTGITDLLINSISLQIKVENLRVPRNYSNPSIPFLHPTHPTPACSMEIYGGKRWI